MPMTIWAAIAVSLAPAPLVGSGIVEDEGGAVAEGDFFWLPGGALVEPVGH